MSLSELVLAVLISSSIQVIIVPSAQVNLESQLQPGSNKLDSQPWHHPVPGQSNG